jgi:hypothetical protein
MRVLPLLGSILDVRAPSSAVALVRGHGIGMTVMIARG